MANGRFVAWVQHLHGEAGAAGHPTPDLEGGDQRIVCVDTADDDPVLATDVDLADILAGARVAVSGDIAGTLTISSNTLTWDHADVTITAVTGDQFEELTYYNHTGTDSTSLLLVTFDTGVTGLPLTPNGGDVVIASHASGVATL